MRLKHCCDCGLHTSVGCDGCVGANSGSRRDGAYAIGIPRRMGNLHLLIARRIFPGRTMEIERRVQTGMQSADRVDWGTEHVCAGAYHCATLWHPGSWVSWGTAICEWHG